MIKTIRMMNDYFMHISTKREFYRLNDKHTSKKYSPKIRRISKMHALTYGIDKLITPKVLTYAAAHKIVLRGGRIDFKNIYKVSVLDTWLLATNKKRKPLYPSLIKIMSDNDGFSEKFLKHAANVLKTACDVFGDNPVQVYFRNYHNFKFNSTERFIFEQYIGINFDKYFWQVPDLCVEEILKMSKSKSLNNYIIFNLLKKYGVNVLDVLNIREEDVKL